MNILFITFTADGHLGFLQLLFIASKTEHPCILLYVSFGHM